MKNLYALIMLAVLATTANAGVPVIYSPSSVAPAMRGFSVDVSTSPAANAYGVLLAVDDTGTTWPQNIGQYLQHTTTGSMHLIVRGLEARPTAYDLWIVANNVASLSGATRVHIGRRSTLDTYSMTLTSTEAVGEFLRQLEELGGSAAIPIMDEAISNTARWMDARRKQQIAEAAAQATAQIDATSVK